MAKKIKFNGSEVDLMKFVMPLRRAGEWEGDSSHLQFRSHTGAILCWWKSTGTIIFQGPESAAFAFQDAFLRKAECTKSDRVQLIEVKNKSVRSKKPRTSPKARKAASAHQPHPGIRSPWKIPKNALARQR